MITSINEDRANWPSLTGAVTITGLPAYVNDCGANPNLPQGTGLTKIAEYATSGDDQTLDTRRPQGIAYKDGIIIQHFQFRPPSSFPDCQKLQLIDPAQGTAGRWRNINLLQPTGPGGVFQRIETACGGIGVHGNYLYTGSNLGARSIRVFDLREFYPLAGNESAIDGTDAFADEYPFFLPQVGQIFVTPPESAGVGWVSIADNFMCVGNFYDPDNGFIVGGKSMIWKMPMINDANYEFPIMGTLEQLDPLFPAGPDVGETLTRIQAALWIDNVLICSRSWSTDTENLVIFNTGNPTKFFCGTAASPQTFDDSNWLFGCEGLCPREDGEFMTITEFTTDRSVTVWSVDEAAALVGANQRNRSGAAIQLHLRGRI